MTKKSKPVPPPAALAPPTTSTTNGKKKSNASKSTPAAKMPLQDVICCVETFNSDGIDSSAGHIQTLKGLGAQVENSGIRVGLTHLIWSNGNIKHLKAAEFMDITVVSPLWVEQCRESASKAPENDFLITSDNVIVSDGKSKLSAPIPDAANTLPEPDSPSLNSSKRASSGSKSKAKSNAVPTESKPPAKSSKKVSPPQKETKSGQPSPPPSPPPPPTSSIAKSSKTKSKSQTPDVDEEDDQSEEKTPIKATKKTAPQKEDKKITSKTEQVRNTSSSSSSSVHVDCQLIALSGFEGEQRIFLTDLVQSLLTSVQPTASSSSSSKSSLSNFSLIEDDDLSLDSLTTCSHLIAGTDPMRRTLRVIFGMVLGIPIVTQEWLLKCLENRYWVDTLPYLHPRFDRSRTTTKSKQRKQTASLAVYVAVGQSSNPSQEIIQSLINNWHRSHLVTSPMEAEYVIVDNQQSSAEPTIYEMRASLSHLFKKSTEETYLSNLLEEGKILTCKILFDCIEAGDLQPHPYAKKSTSSSSSTTVSIKGKKLKIPPPVDNDDDEEEEEVKQKPAAKKPRKGTPKRAPKAKVVESADSESDHSNYPTPIKLSLLEEDSPPVHQIKPAQHSLLRVRHDEEKEVVWHGRGKGAKKRPISPEPLPQKNAGSGQVNDNEDDEEEEEVITPSRKKSRAALTSPLRSKIALQDLEDNEEEEEEGLLALGGVVSGGGGVGGGGEEASPSW